MAFYDEIAKDIPWEYASNVDAYLKIKNGKLQLPNPKWLQFHLRFLENVIEAIHAFRNGELRGKEFDLDSIEKRVIRDPEEGITFLRELETKYKTYSIDIESNNLSTDKAKNKLLCIGLAYEDNKGVSFTYECFVSPDFRCEFQSFVSNPDFCFILHNGVFDRSRTRIIEDITLKIDEDTLLMHYCGINEHKGTHGLKDLAQLYLGFPDWEAELDEWRRKYERAHKVKHADFQYEYFPQQMLAEYNVIDCCATFQLKKVFEKLMRENSLYIYRKLIEAAPYYADMIVRGMQMDVGYWQELQVKLLDEKFQLEDEFAKLMPGISVSSPMQLKRWLQQRFPHDGVESTNAKTIEDLYLKYPEEETLQKILAYRKNSKYLKTYVTGLWTRKDYNNIIHCEFKLHGTETGRLSSSNPNMQNIPRSPLIKSLFVAREGYTLLQLDYSQLELRVLAHISGDETLIQCYKDGRDLHSEMQEKIFKKDYDPHNKDQRMAAKIVNFGIPYGRGPASVAQQLKVDMTTAKRYLADWHAGAPRVKNYIAKCHNMATAEPQQVWYTVFGRARHYFITSENLYHTQNQSVNFPITSTANDITIHALVEIGKWLEEQKLDAYLVNTVHDSIILEVRPEDAHRVAEKCQEIMAAIPPRYLVGTEVPFRADAEIGECWGKLAEADWSEIEDLEEDEE